MMNRADRISALYVLVLILGAVCLLVTIPVCSKKSTEPPPPQNTPSTSALDSLSAKSAAALLLSGTDSSSVTISIGANARTWKGYRIETDPVIHSIEPLLCTFGTQFTIRGKRFDIGTSSCFVYIGETHAPWQEWNDTMIVATVRSCSISGDVRVRRGSDYWSNAVPMTVFGITSVKPWNVRVGNTVAITGTGFGESQGANTVLLDGMLMPVLSWSDEEIVFNVPEGSESGQINVEIDGTLSNGSDLWVIPDVTELLETLQMTNCIRMELVVKVRYTNDRIRTLNVGCSSQGNLEWDNHAFSADGGIVLEHTCIEPTVVTTGEVDTNDLSLGPMDVQLECYMDWPYEPGSDPWELHEYGLSLLSLPLASWEMGDTVRVRFEAEGSQVADIVQDLSVHHVYSGDTYHSYRLSEIYWDDPEVIPHLIVTFEQQ